MAHNVMTLEFVLIATVDLSAHVQEAGLTYEAEAIDQSTMGVGTRAMIGGLKNWSCEATFAQDFAAAQVDVTLFPLVGTIVAVEFRPTNAARSTTNPAYTGNALVTKYNPLTGRVGELMTCAVSLVAAGALSRLTA
ncbi:MAG: radical SAM protein [Gemmatimonadales bacterium]